MGLLGLFSRGHLNKNYSFFLRFFCASCLTKFFTRDVALHEWMLLNAP